MNKISIKVLPVAVFLIFQMGLTNGQSIYLKSGGAFCLPINTQNTPEYFTFRIFSSGTSGYGFGVLRQNDSKISIAEGINFNGSIGYNFNSIISVEIGLSYFANTRKVFNTYSLNSNSDWHYQNFCLLPSVLIGKTLNNKSRINLSLSAGLGFGDLNITASIPEYFSKYSFSKSISYSYSYGIEYLHNLSASLQLSANAGINNIFYTPKHAELVSSTGHLEYLTVWYKQIDYVNGIENYISDYDKPETRLQETLKLNSFYLGLGIKYTFPENEKK
jgi:hypothetical protein